MESDRSVFSERLIYRNRSFRSRCTRHRLKVRDHEFEQASSYNRYVAALFESSQSSEYNKYYNGSTYNGSKCIDRNQNVSFKELNQSINRQEKKGAEEKTGNY